MKLSRVVSSYEYPFADSLQFTDSGSMQASASQLSPPKQCDIRQLTLTVATRYHSPQVGCVVAWCTSACSCPRRETAKGPTHFKSRCSPICRALFETVPISLRLLMPVNSCSGSRSRNCLLPFLNQAVVCTYVLRSQHSQVPHWSYFFFSWSSDGEDENVLLQAAQVAGAVAASTANLTETLQDGPLFVTVFYLPLVFSRISLHQQKSTSAG